MNHGPLFERQTCSALVITCSDFRFKRAEQAFVEAARLGDDYDLMARPGAIRSLVLPRSEAARASMEEEMRLLWRLHRFARVLMVQHVSCRAYDDIADRTTERAVHAQHLEAARPIVERMLGGVRAEAYIVEPGDDGALQVVAVAR
jgi:hypothetical protein